MIFLLFFNRPFEVYSDRARLRSICRPSGETPRRKCYYKYKRRVWNRMTFFLILLICNNIIYGPVYCTGRRDNVRQLSLGFDSRNAYATHTLATLNYVRPVV